MKVQFRTYRGLAGDLQELLIGENIEGQSKSILIPSVGPRWYRLWRMRKAKRYILNELEILTGTRHHEAI